MAYGERPIKHGAGWGSRPRGTGNRESPVKGSYLNWDTPPRSAWQNQLSDMTKWWVEGITSLNAIARRRWISTPRTPYQATAIKKMLTL